MPILDLIEKLVNEHGSAAIRGEVIELLREQATVEAKKLAEVISERDALRLENVSLRDQVVQLTKSPSFVEVNGILWRLDANGQYEDAPYCPKCKMVMHEEPPRAVTRRPFQWTCSSCNFSVSHCKAPQAQPSS